MGTDVFAPHGTPVRSPIDGTISSGSGSLGGLFVKVFQPDGTYFYMAHLSGLAEGFTEGMAVQTGDIVGYVGDSGNRSEEHTSELQSLMRISSAVFCLKTKNQTPTE